jgi:hypothetical protein
MRDIFEVVEVVWGEDLALDDGEVDLELCSAMRREWAAAPGGGCAKARSYAGRLAGPGGWTRCRRPRRLVWPRRRPGWTSPGRPAGQRPRCRWWARSDRTPWPGARPRRPGRPASPLGRTRARRAGPAWGGGGQAEVAADPGLDRRLLVGGDDVIPLAESVVTDHGGRAVRRSNDRRHSGRRFH